MSLFLVTKMHCRLLTAGIHLCDERPMVQHRHPIDPSVSEADPIAGAPALDTLAHSKTGEWVPCFSLWCQGFGYRQRGGKILCGGSALSTRGAILRHRTAKAPGPPCGDGQFPACPAQCSLYTWQSHRA